MNTIGKILVVLNFLFALVMATLVALNYTTTNNWKNQEEKYRKELEAAHANNAAQAQTLADKINQLQDAKTSLESAKSDIAVKEAEIATIKAADDIKLKDSENRAQAQTIIAEKAIAAAERHQKETVQLRTIIADREDRIVKLHTKLKDTTDLAMTLDRDLKFSQERNQILVRRVQELEVALAQATQPASEKTQVVSRDRSELNPPPRFVKGVVERVDGVDKSLVKISLGTDHGVHKDNTLEVYRTNPVQYLGVIRIEDANYHTSVGRLIRIPGVKTADIREGDTVASGLDSRR